jgi:hypothetical protein
LAARIEGDIRMKKAGLIAASVGTAAAFAAGLAALTHFVMQPSSVVESANAAEADGPTLGESANTANVAAGSISRGAAAAPRNVDDDDDDDDDDHDADD